MSEVRRALLEATLRHVPFDGWSERALRAGASDAGLDPATARRAFRRGIAGVLAFWSAESDRRMIEALESRDLAALRVRERIAAAVRVRLEVSREHREAIRLALGRAVMPQHAPEAAAALWRTVDAMWRAAGDTATDFNYYTKRGLLAGVYGATLLYWLDDRSEDFAATWAFLDRRIADVMKVPRALGRLGKWVPDVGWILRARRPRRPARR